MTLATGTEVQIIGGDHADLVGQWGIVLAFDGDVYHVSPMNGTEVLTYDRSELRVRRSKGDKREA